MTSETVLEMPRLPPPVEDIETEWPKALLGNEGRRERFARTRSCEALAFARGKYHSTNTYSLRSKSVTSAYAGFRTFIAMLRILKLFSSEAQHTICSDCSLTRTRAEITQTGESDSSSRRSAWSAPREMLYHSDLG